MSAKTLYWLIAAIAVAAAALALSALIVLFVPNESSTAAIAAEQPVLEHKIESIVESKHRAP
ncbi:MAG TPA: hypothetical protein VMN79_16245 [Casimicrobiaceae bacterium]|nr:hypothetical protein [Casimicrobiaceae bacterium]